MKGTRTAPQCGFSHRVMSMLTESGTPFDVVNVLDETYNPGLREAIKTYSQWPTIPQVVCFNKAASLSDRYSRKGLVPFMELNMLLPDSHGHAYSVV